MFPPRLNILDTGPGAPYLSFDFENLYVGRNILWRGSPFRQLRTRVKNSNILFYFLECTQGAPYKAYNHGNEINHTKK